MSRIIVRSETFQTTLVYIFLYRTFFRVFRRMKIKYRIIIMKLCMRKCEIVKKIEIRIYVMIKKNYCVYVMLKKM